MAGETPALPQVNSAVSKPSLVVEYHGIEGVVNGAMYR